MDSKKETQIISKAKLGSREAFSQLFNLHADKLFRFLQQFTEDRDEAKDWTQDAFIKAFRYIDNFQGTSRFSTWLFKIGLNEMRSEFKKKKRFATENLKENEILYKVEFEDDFEWHQDMKWLLSELADDKKAIFILYEVEGYSHSEIAEMLDISVANCRTSLSRTKKILREKWLKESEIN